MDRRSGWSLLATLALAAALPIVVTDRYGIQLLNMALIFSILTLGFYVLFGLTGIFAVSQVAFWGIGAYTSAILTATYKWPFWGGLLAAMVVTTMAGVLLGLPTLKLRSYYLTMTTIGFAEAVRIIATNTDRLTGGPNGIGRIPAPQIGPLLLNTPARMFYLSLALLGVIILGLIRLSHSRLGRSMQSVRDDELAAEAMGVNVTRIKVMAFALSALAGGIAGPLYGALTAFISPDAFTLAVTVQVTAMLVIGGRSSIPGAVAGAVLLTYLPEWLRQLKDWYMAIYGLGLLVILIFLPEGLGGGVRKLWTRLVRRWHAGSGKAEPGGAAR